MFAHGKCPLASLVFVCKSRSLPVEWSNKMLNVGSLRLSQLLGKPEKSSFFNHNQ